MIRQYLFIIIFAASFASGKSEQLTRSEEIGKNNFTSISQKYLVLDKQLKELVNYGAKRMLPYILEANEHLNTSLSCRKDMLLLFGEIRKLKLSAMKFLDALGKVPSGLLLGNINIVGDYDECLNSSIALKNGSIAFRGKYCLLNVQPVLPNIHNRLNFDASVEKLVQDTRNTSEFMQFILSLATKFHSAAKLGLCVPSGCSDNDINQSLKYIGEKVFMNASIAYCEVEEGVPYPSGRIVAITIFSLLGLFLILGTLTDYIMMRENNKPEAFEIKFLLCFSVLRNFPKVIRTKSPDQSLMCLNGIRVLSQFYIMLLHHHILMGLTNFEGHMLHYANTMSTLFFQIILNAFLTVDVFFLLGGLINMYTRLKPKEENRKNINYIAIIRHRLWRIYPSLFCSILVVFLFYDFRGPLKKQLHDIYSDKCKTFWWRTVLFINNFYENTDACVPQSWYISADMQMFLMSLIVTYVFWRNGWKGVMVSILLIIIGICSTVAMAWRKNLMPSIIFSTGNLEELELLQNAYTFTYPHLAPYFIGVIIGYVLRTKQDIKLSKVHQYIGWTIATFAFTSMLFVTKRWNSGVHYTVAESSMYFALSRPIYASAVGWMILCCAKGYGGIINYILSLKIWVPLARISYMLFLVSPSLQVFSYGNLRMPPDSHLMITIWRYFAEVTVSCFLCLALVVTVECPFEEIEKLLFQRKPSKDEDNVESPVENYNNDIGYLKAGKSLDWDKNLNTHIELKSIVAVIQDK